MVQLCLFFGWNKGLPTYLVMQTKLFQPRQGGITNQTTQKWWIGIIATRLFQKLDDSTSPTMELVRQ